MQFPVLEVPDHPVAHVRAEKLIPRDRNTEKRRGEVLNLTTVALGDRDDLGEKALQEFNLDLCTVDARHKMVELLYQRDAPLVYYCLCTEFGVRGGAGTVSETDRLDAAPRKILRPILSSLSVKLVPSTTSLVVELIEHL